MNPDWLESLAKRSQGSRGIWAHLGFASSGPTTTREGQVEVTLTDIAADFERQTKVTYDEVRHIWQNTLEAFVTPELIEEHRTNPFGRHSPELDMVLTFLRSDWVQSHPRLVVVTLTPEKEWAIGEHPRQPGVTVRVRPETYESVDEIEHAIFLERLKVVQATFATA